MSTKIKKRGKFELFETTDGNEILVLNDEDWYALLEGDKGEMIIHSDSDHEKKKTLKSGEFYYADFEDEPDFNDIPHLLLQQDGKYREFILPNGLPTEKDYQKKLIRTDEKVSEEKILEHTAD